MSALIFLGILIAFVVVAFLVSRITGARAHFLDDWTPEPGEEILFEDRDVQLMVTTITKGGGAGPPLLPNAFVLVTNKRVLAGQRPLFSRRFMIKFVIYPGHAPGPEADSIWGGEFKRGFRSLVVEPGVVHRVLDARKPYVELAPAPDSASSFNIEAFRIYSRKASSFRLPPTIVGDPPNPS